jgi:signal transduction histidine kinase
VQPGVQSMVEEITSIEKKSEKVNGALEDLLIEAADPSERTLSFMDRLSEPDRQALEARGRQIVYTAGMVICREGEPGDSLYVVESGQVAVLKEMSDGRSTLLGYRGAGEILGEMSLLGQQPRSASNVAVEDTTLLCISAADFPLLMDNHPGISWAILKVLNDRLQAADTARTSILQTEQHLQRRVNRLTTEAERQAELIRAREETLELIAHDLRTPLTVIDGCLQMLQTTLPKDVLASAGEIIELAARSSERLSSLVGAMLDAAHQKEAGLTLVCEPVDLAELVEAATRSAMPTAATAEIDLVWHTPPDLPQPLADLDKLERVVMNLLENAISYSPDGGSITMEAAVRGKDVEVSVTDSGPGVPPEYRERIFERFAQVPGVTGRHKGFGLGLYFCQQVIQAHGGRIWVEPGPESVGSRFVFALPLERRTLRD